MKRLIEFEVDSPPMKVAKRLVASLPPLPESAERMWRIRRELDWVFLNSGHVPRASGLRLRGVTALYRQLSATTVAGLLILCGASAFAAIRVMSALVKQPAPLTAAETQRSHELPSDRLTDLAEAAQAPVDAAPQPLVSSPDPEAKSPPQRTHRAKRMAARLRAQRMRAQRAAASEAAVYDSSMEAPVQRATPPETSVEADDPTEQRGPSKARSPGAGVTDNDIARKETTPNERARSADEAGSELVHRALRALRRDGDAALAARLLERHRARDPDGPLVEEALALQIEASATLGQPRARAFAREYLTRYPSGRYRKVAERVLANSKP